MKKTINLLLLIAVITLFACNKEMGSKDVGSGVSGSTPETPAHEYKYTVSYIVGYNVNTVNMDTDEEMEALLERFCDYAQEGSAVTFRSENKASKSAKAPTTFSTRDREEMLRWMAQMEDAGMTVTVTYDRDNNTWHGTAYCVAQHEQATAGRRLSRITYFKERSGSFCAIYDYTWNGDLLTRVDIEEGDYYSTRKTRSSAELSYDNGLCVAISFYDSTGTLLRQHRYSYFDGRLVQEWQSTNNQTYAFQYDSIGNIVAWVITPEYNTAIPVGERCEWANGDMVRTYNQGGQLGIYEYDNSPHPYGITFGTKTLMPGSTYMSGQEIHWSQHNITHYRAVNSKSSGTDLRINYTYDDRGYPITAETNWFGAYNITWNYEYLD